MDDPYPPRDAARPILFLGIGLGFFAAALSIRLLGIGGMAIGLDEVYTQFAVTRDWIALILERSSRGHLPLYFLTVKALPIEPHDIVSMRSVSAVFDALAAGIFAVGIARYVSIRAGLWAGAFYVTAPALLDWAQNARPYGLAMAAIALGTVGAIGLIRSWTEDRDSTASSLAFRAGWITASLTLTAGILAFLCVVITPYVRRGPFRSPAFRNLWRKSLIWPSALAFLAYFAVSRVHVYEQIGNYWIENYRPFGWESLLAVLNELVAGMYYPEVLGLPQSVQIGMIAALSCGLIALAIRGALQTKLQPWLWPLIALAAGYALLLVLASLSTSLLIGRYFLPAWLGVLGLAAVGVADLRPLWQRLVGLPVLALSGLFAWDNATAASVRYEPDSAAAALAIEDSPYPDAPVYIAGEFLLELRRDLLTLRLEDPSRERPYMRRATSENLADQLERGTPFFLVAGRGEAIALLRGVEQTTSCSAESGALRVDLLGIADCPKGFLRRSGQ